MRLIQAASNPDLLNAEDGFFRIPPLEEPSGTLMERLHRYRLQGELPSKFVWALNKLEELRSADQKCVVWTNFIRNIDQFTRLVRGSGLTYRFLVLTAGCLLLKHMAMSQLTNWMKPESDVSISFSIMKAAQF